MTRTTAALIAAGLAVAMLAAPASAEDGSRQTAKLKFTTAKPGAPTGHRLRIDYVNPEDPAAKPPAVRRVVERFARGTRIDTAAPELCTATDAELTALGTAACSGGSWLGSGMVMLDTGFPQPGRFLASPIDYFNNSGEMILLNRTQATEAPRVVTRSRVRGRRFVTELGPLPGAPPDGAAIDTVRGDFARVVTDRGSYLTTPRRCPRRGFWRNRIRFTYADGVSEKVISRSRCRAGIG